MSTFALAVSLGAQQPTHPTSTPYAGDLSIFENADRADRLHVDRVMDVLRLKPGRVVADIGAGGGWFSVRAARRVASEKPGQPAGQVIAEDINPRYVDAVRERAQREHLGNIEPVLGTPDDPKLPPNMLDAAIMLRVYHEVAHPAVLLANLNRAMKPGALFGVIDHDGRGDDHGINADVVRAEVEHSGLHFVRRYDFTHADQNDYMLIFEKR